MAEQISRKKLRRLRQPTQTVRERAERAAEPKKNRRLYIRLPFGSVIKRFLSRLGRLKFWKPLKATFRFLGRVLIPPYIRHSVYELRQVAWPNRRQTLQLTTAVIMFALVFGVIVAVFDTGLDKVFKELIIKR